MSNNEQMENALVMARRARNENNAGDAAKYYDLVRSIAPDNLEARFFYSYYYIWDGNKGEMYSRYINTCNTTITIAKELKTSSYSGKELNELVGSIYDNMCDLCISVSKVQVELYQTAQNSQYNTQNKDVQSKGISVMYLLGDCIEESFSGNAELMKIAVKAWKQGVTLQQKWPYCGVKKELIETYMAKIKKYDPSFVLPKKAGCISFA